MTTTIHLAILSSSRILADAMSSRLISEDGLEVLGTAATLHDLLASQCGEQADVVLVHAADDPAGVPQVVGQIRRLLPSTRVVAMGRRPGEPDTARAIEAGASAWLEDGTSYAELVEAIRAAGMGRATGSLEMLVEIHRRMETRAETSKPTTAPSRPMLSKRETDVARLMALGLVNKQIAGRLKIKLSTAKKHVYNVMRKLRIEHRGDLTRYV